MCAMQNENYIFKYNKLHCFLTISIQVIFLYELDVFISGSEWKGSFSGENYDVV